MSSSAMRVDTCTNPNAITVHTRRRLVAGMVLSGDWAEEFPAAQRMLAKRLMAIEGVTDLIFSKYDFLISKGDLFQWDELMDGIRAAVGEFCEAAKS